MPNKCSNSITKKGYNLKAMERVIPCVKEVTKKPPIKPDRESTEVYGMV